MLNIQQYGTQAHSTEFSWDQNPIAEAVERAELSSFAELSRIASRNNLADKVVLEIAELLESHTSAVAGVYR
jgi:hypothetical protein